MSTTVFFKTIRSVAAISIIMILIGCGGGGGGGDGGSDGQSLSVSITSPSDKVALIEGQSVNFQGSVSHGKSPYQYSWDFNGAAPNSSSQNPGIVTLNKPGILTITFRVSSNRCKWEY